MSLTPKDIEGLSAFLDGELSAGARASVEKLLTESAEARAFLKDLRALRGEVKGLPPLAPPDAFYARVMRDLDASPRRRSFWSYVPTKTFGALAAAALVVVATHDLWKPGPARQAMELRRQEAPSPLEMFQDRLGAQQMKVTRMDVRPAEDRAKNELDQKKSGTRDAEGMKKDFGAVDERKRLEESLAKTAAPEPYALPAAVAAGRLDAPARKVLSKDEGAALKSRRAGSPAEKERAATPFSEIALDGASSARPEAAAPSLQIGGGALAGARAPAAASGPASSLQEWRGEQSMIRDRRLLAVRDAGAWETLWREHAGDAPLPRVDFTHDMVIAVFAGEEPTAGHGVEILSVVPAGRGARVLYKLTPPRGFAAQVLTQPFHIRIVPRRDGPLEFIQK